MAETSSQKRTRLLDGSFSNVVNLTTPRKLLKPASRSCSSFVSLNPYDALDSGLQQIRLLEIRPSLDDKAPIQSRICHVSLLAHPTPSYETISYVWGSPNRKGWLTMNESNVCPPTSSIEALRCVRLPQSHKDRMDRLPLHRSEGLRGTWTASPGNGRYIPGVYW